MTRKICEPVRKSLLQSILFSKWLKGDQEKDEIGIPYKLQLFWWLGKGRTLCTIGHILSSAWGLTSVHSTDRACPESDRLPGSADHFCSPSSTPHRQDWRAPSAICSTGHALNNPIALEVTSLIEDSSTVHRGKFPCSWAKHVTELCTVLESF